MPLNTDEILLIQDYLSGKLSSEEIIKFEEKLTDPTFREEFQLQIVVREAIVAGGRDHVKQIIKGFETNPVSKKNESKRNWVKWLLAVFLLILMVYSIIHLLKPPTPAQLFAANFEIMANVVDPIARGETDELSAYHLYENSRYAEALDLFNEVEPSQNKLLYEGLCYISLEDINQAILKFENGLKLPPEGLEDNLEWYLLLAYIKNGDVQKAIDFGKELQKEETHQYIRKINSIVRKLENM